MAYLTLRSGGIKFTPDNPESMSESPDINKSHSEGKIDPPENKPENNDWHISTDINTKCF
jgi:hypothetical protein